ncbi:MAG: TolC family protein [Phycisphaera sp.]|nr:TolC family protein [Phycisphaera sp.]
MNDSNHSIRHRIQAIASIVVLGGAAGCDRSFKSDELRIADLRESVGTVPSVDDVVGVTPGRTLEEINAVADGEAGPAGLGPERIEMLTSPGVGIELSIEEARHAALTNNMGLRGVLLGPEIAEKLVRYEEARFESTLDLSVGSERTIAPAYNAFGNENFTVENENFVAAPTLNIPLRTGGAVSLDWSVGSQVSNNEISSSPSVGLAGSVASVAIEQPILRGGGIDFNSAPIVLARTNAGEVEARTQYAVIRTILDTEVAYWSLHRAWAILEAYKDIYEYTRKVLADARVLNEAGAGSVSGIYTFEVALAKTISSLIEAENHLNLVTRELKSLIQDPDLSLETSVTITPGTSPVFRMFTFDRTALVRQALRNRGDLLALEFKEIESAIEVMVAENELLPRLDLVGSYSFVGFDSTSSSMRSAQSDMFNEGFNGANPQGWSVGMMASIPLGNEQAIATYQASLLRRLKAISDTSQREILVGAEVLDAVDSLQSDWDQILVSRSRIASARRNLDLMERLYTMGEVTSTDVVVAIRLFADSRVAVADADSNYQISLARLSSSIGCVLGFSGIEWRTLQETQRLEDAQDPILDGVGDPESP